MCLLIKKRSNVSFLFEPSRGLEYVKEYWHSDLEFSCERELAFGLGILLRKAINPFEPSIL
ncbi:hypothetical protein RhiirA1_481590 [Rhizophagus irregularis]|uniref:Uncharacterized protein n=1 Tax=Rhizophagus irregularis TaxID=588596 RepID=A0A2N0QMW6_9GLOM|nr:hypothetical protein RhiirA1_481590 [Rhizophagus irregularis]